MTTITQEELISKFKKTSTSEIFELDKISDQIIWVLKKILIDFKIDEYIPASIISNILIESIGISSSPKQIINTLNPIKKKIHPKSIEGELSYKIMNEGISHISKLINNIAKKSSKKRPSQKAILDDTIKEIRYLRDQKKIEPGLYYIVFIDLNNSSSASSKLRPTDNQKRIDYFISLTKKSLSKKSRSFSVFIKPIGDGALFLFTNFEDILDWANTIDEICNTYNNKCINEHKPEIFQLYSKKCVHLGEVHFNDQLDPIAFAINQIFKIEKDFKKSPLGITDIVKQVIIPRINSGELKAEKITDVVLVGETESRPIWNIAYR